MDTEITAMATISDAIEKLDSDARTRVLQWAASKYGMNLPVSPKGPVDVKTGTVSQETSTDVSDAVNHQFETFADLYAAANPAKDAEKVLIAAYWHQVVKGQKELTSGVLNKDLANLGHRIVNINMKFDILIASKPQLALGRSEAELAGTFLKAQQGARANGGIGHVSC